MGCLEGSGVPVLYIGRTVPKGLVKLSELQEIKFLYKLFPCAPVS